MPAKNGLISLGRDKCQDNRKKRQLPPTKRQQTSSQDTIKNVIEEKGYLPEQIFNAELIDTTPEELTEDDLMEMSASKPVPEDEEEDVEETEPENKLTLDRRVPISQGGL